MTSRDFYRGIASLIKLQKLNPASLEQYLTSLWARSNRLRSQPGLPAAEFQKLLEDSFTPVDAKPGNDPMDELANGFKGWDSTLRRQIRDLQEMEVNGQLKNDQRYFGIDSPNGGRWYNFDPCGYLECARTGTFGGWEEGDETGREYVPGKVAAPDVKGTWVSADPREFEEIVVQLEFMTWDELKSFLWNGQQYE